MLEHVQAYDALERTVREHGHVAQVSPHIDVVALEVEREQFDLCVAAESECERDLRRDVQYANFASRWHLTQLRVQK